MTTEEINALKVKVYDLLVERENYQVAINKLTEEINSISQSIEKNEKQ